MEADLFEVPEDIEVVNVPIAQLAAPDYIAQTWSQRGPMYASALERSWQVEDELENLAVALAQGKAWAIDVRLGDEILASSVVEKLETKGGVMLNIWVCAGRSMDEWLPEILECIEGWAVVIGARGVMLSGREGWQRALKKYGYETTNITLKKGFERCH